MWRCQIILSKWRYITVSQLPPPYLQPFAALAVLSVFAKMLWKQQKRSSKCRYTCSMFDLIANENESQIETELFVCSHSISKSKSNNSISICGKRVKKPNWKKRNKINTYMCGKYAGKKEFLINTHVCRTAAKFKIYPTFCLPPIITRR